MQRRQLLIAGLLAPLLGLAGRRESLQLAAFPSVDAILRAARMQWAVLRPGVDLEIVSRQYDDHHTAMATAIATRSHLPDVMAIELSYLGRFVGSGAFEDLTRPPFNASPELRRFVPFSVKQARTHDGGLAALPADVAPGALFYRADVLSKTAVGEPDLTHSWESYVAAGAQIKAATGAYLICHATELKNVLIRSNLGPGQGVYLDTSGKVLIESDRFRRAFELARKLRIDKLDAKVVSWSSEWTEGLRRGAIATQMMGTWFAGHLQNWLAPTTTGLWRSAPLPEGAQNAWGGTFYAIPKGAPNRELAWELIKLMSLNPGRQLAAFRAEGSFPALLETYQDSFFDEPIAFLGGQAARREWRDAAAAIPAFPVHKLDPIAAEIVDSALDEVLTEGKSIASALSEARSLLDRRVERA